MRATSKVRRPAPLAECTAQPEQAKAGLLAKLDAEIAAKIAERQEKADPESDIDSQFEAVADFLDAIRYVVEADEVFEKKYGELTLALDQAKAAVAARKSEDEDEPSFFESVPRAMQREQQGGRSIFSDVDE